MTDQLNIRAMHKEAMEYAQQALVAKEKGDDELALQLYVKAFEIEEIVALSLINNIEKEPTRSILFRSAASLANICGEYREAERMINFGLSGNPPEDIAEELRNLYEEINFYRHLKLKGESLESVEMQLSISGNGVSYGLTPSDAFNERIHAIEQLTLRSAERLSGKPYRQVGQPSKEIKENVTIYLATPMAASFAVKIRLGKPTNQTSLELGLGIQEKVIDDIFSGLELIKADKELDLKKRITDENYYQNFLSMTKALSPDGDRIRQVGITIIKKGKQKSVSLVRKQSEVSLLIPPKPSKLNSYAESSFQMIGSIRVANAIKNTIEIIPESGNKQKIIVPSGLSDIVKVYWDSIVKVTVKPTKKGELELIDLEKQY